jgi:hypothetical protein
VAKILKWRGPEVLKAVSKNVAMAMGEFGLRVEGHSKKELRKGHGVITSTARRSIHVAQPGYNWSGDNVVANNNSPERGNQKFDAVVNGRKITIQVGSGLGYALPLHQGHHSFEGYHFLTIGLDKAKPELPAVLKKYRLK